MMDPKRIVARAKIKYDPHVGREYRSSKIICTSWKQNIDKSQIREMYIKKSYKNQNLLAILMTWWKSNWHTSFERCSDSSTTERARSLSIY